MTLLLGHTCAPALRVKKLRPGACLPEYQTAGAAGLDLAACIDAPLTLAPGEIRVIPCGFAMALPEGWEGQVRPRSGLASRHGITLANAPGTIDCDYRGEVMIPLINHGPAPFVVEHGMRIAQMVIAQVSRARVCETEDLEAEDDARAPVRGADLSRAFECRSFPPKADDPAEQPVSPLEPALAAAASAPPMGPRSGSFLSGATPTARAASLRTRGEGGFGSTGL